MAPILLACPTCRKRISSSAHSCPHCGEPLTNEWEEEGRKKIKRRRMGLAILLVPLSFAIGAVIVAINIEPPRQLGLQMPIAPLPQPTAPAKEAQATVRAFGFKPGNGQRGLFIAIREREQSFEGRQVRVLCPVDGTGEVVAALDGAYVAVNGAARGWAGSKEFWAVQGQRLMPIADSGFPNNVPQRFALLERHMDEIVKTGVGMCPLTSPAAESAWKSLRSAVGNYEANARSLGISIP